MAFLDRSKNGRIVLAWWHWILAVDIFLVLVLILKRFDVPGIWLIYRYFNLSVEMNGAVWWSAICLLAPGLLAYILFCRTRERTRWPWLALSLVLAGLSLDEIGSLHERVSAGDDRGWMELLPYGTILLCLTIYALVALYRKAETRRSAVVIGAAFFAFGSVALQEHLAVNTEVWSGGIERIRQGLEEGTELIGSLLLFWGIIPQLWEGNRPLLRAAIPNPYMMRHVPAILFWGFLLHSFASLLVPALTDVTQKGNPLVWYPIASLFLAFSATFWRSLDSSTARPKVWGQLSIFLLLCSALFSYAPSDLLSPTSIPLSGRYLTTALLLVLVSLIILLAARLPGFWSRNIKYIPVLILLPFFSFLGGGVEMEFFLYGLFSYLAFLLVWERPSTGNRPSTDLSNQPNPA